MSTTVVQLPPPVSTHVPPLRVVSMREQGASLPIGTLGPNERLTRHLASRPFRFRDERELTRRKGKPAATMTQYVSEFLASMLTTFGHHDFTKLSDDEKRLVLNQAPMADVTFAWAWLRTEALGAILEMTVQCAGCRTKFKWPADLLSTEVKVVDEVGQLARPFQLRDGIELDGTLWKNVVVAPPSWNVMERLSVKQVQEMGVGDISALMIRSSIVEVKGYSGSGLLNDNVLDEMSMRDVVALRAFIDENSPGPDLSAEAECPRCGAVSSQAMDWSYASFFGKSGR